jgi:hypothetical protein
MTTLEDWRTLSIREGFTLLLDERQLERLQCLTVTAGLLRVGASRLAEEALQVQPVTLGFLQSGDRLPLDLLRNRRLHLQALTSARLEDGCPTIPAAGVSSLHDWTLELLLIRDLSDAERRITALLQLLVQRIGRRGGAWYELPLRLTHTDLAQLCGHSRVTVTRQFSRWREQGLLEQEGGAQGPLRLAPALIEG